jgi:hypothetical protein
VKASLSHDSEFTQLDSAIGRVINLTTKETLSSHIF